MKVERAEVSLGQWGQEESATVLTLLVPDDHEINLRGIDQGIVQATQSPLPC